MRDARVGTAGPRPLSKQQRVQRVVDNYAAHPAKSARALRKLGMSKDFIRAVHKSQVRDKRTEPAPGSVTKRVTSGLGNFTGVKVIDKTLGGFGETALYALPGAAITARNIGKDVYGAGRGDFSFKRTRKVGSALAHTIPEDVRRARHGDFSGVIMDAAAALTAGGSLVARGAATGRALEEGASVGRALTRTTHEGGSLLHAPPPGVAELKVGGATVRKPLSRNPAYRNVVQKPRYKLAQRRLDAGSPVEPAHSGPARFAEAHGPESLVGKEIAHERRLEQSHAHGEFEHARRVTKRLSRGEHAAIRVVAIEGNRALAHPGEVLRRQIATHKRFIQEGQDAAAHSAAIRDLKLAATVLRNPSEKFLRALDATRDLANLGERESIARNFLTREGAHARKQKIADVYGGHAGEGSFYFHAGPGMPKRNGARVYNPRPGTAGIGKPTAGRYAQELGRSFSGRGIRRGHVPLNIPQSVMQAYARRIHLHSAHDLYDTLRKASTETREHGRQIPIRSTTHVSRDLKRLLAKVEENLHASPDELHALTRNEITRLEEELKAAEHASAPVGARIKGVRWVDERFIKDLGLTPERGGLARVADAITNPTRFATLYFRPAYILNALGNAGMVAMEGPGAAHAVWEAARSQAKHGARNTARMDAAMGSGKALGQAVETGFGRRAVQGLAHGWNNVTDLHMRRSAFLLEAKRAGFTSQSEIHALLHDAALRPKLNEVTRRARAILGDYENLTPFERNAVRRLLYFYPWLKVATKWTGHTLTEHPIKTDVLAANSRDEAEHAAKLLGNLPQWARLSGLVPIGHEHNGLLDTINPSSVNTPSTVVQTAGEAANAARALIGLKQHGTAGLGDLLTPAGQAFVTAGGQADTGRRTGILGALESTPLPSAARRLGIYGKPSKTYPGGGIGPGLGPLGAGGLYPRATSLDALHKAGEKELRADMSHDERTAYDFEKWEREALAILRPHGVKSLPPEYKARLNLWHERVASRRRVANTWEAHTISDLELIYRHGWIDRRQYIEARKNIGKVPKNERASVTRQLTADYFDRDGILHDGAKSIGMKLPR